MSKDLETIRASVERIETVGDSTIALVEGMAATIRDLKDDPAALEAFAARLDAQSEELAAAVAANTPAPPPAESEE